VQLHQLFGTGDATTAELIVMACIMSDEPLSLSEVSSWVRRHSTENHSDDLPTWLHDTRPDYMDFTVPICEPSEHGSQRWTSPIAAANVVLRRRLFPYAPRSPQAHFRIMDLPRSPSINLRIRPLTPSNRSLVRLPKPQDKRHKPVPNHQSLDGRSRSQLDHDQVSALPLEHLQRPPMDRSQSPVPRRPRAPSDAVPRQPVSLQRSFALLLLPEHLLSAKRLGDSAPLPELLRNAIPLSWEYCVAMAEEQEACAQIGAESRGAAETEDACY
jgi:hypothetical protein